MASTVRARRVVLSSALFLSLSLLAAANVSAAPDRGCPDASSGFTTFAIDPTVGDGIDEANAWWVQTVAGLEAEGFTSMDQAAAAFGLADAEALYEFIMAELRGLDHNGDGSFCAKPFPETSKGMPAFAFNAVDNSARAH